MLASFINLIYLTTVMKIHQVPHKILATSLFGGKGEPWVEVGGKLSSNLLHQSSENEPDNLEGPHCLWRRVRKDLDLDS